MDRSIEEMYKFIHLPKNHWNCRLSEIPSFNYKKRISDWIEDIRENLSNGESLYLYGGYGRGKSGIAAILMKVALAHGRFGLWINFRDLHSISINPEDTRFSEYISMLDRIKEVPLLIVTGKPSLE